MGKGVYLTFTIFIGMLLIKNSNGTLTYLGVDRRESRIFSRGLIFTVLCQTAKINAGGIFKN